MNPAGRGAVPAGEAPATDGMAAGPPRESERVRTMRVLSASAVLVSAAVHLYLWFEGFREVDVIGPAFMLNAVAGAVIAGLLLAWRHWVPPFLALGFGLSTLSAFVISTTVGLFGSTATWAGWAAWTAAGAEVVAVVTGLVLLLGDNPLRSQRQLQHHPPVGRTNLH